MQAGPPPSIQNITHKNTKFAGKTYRKIFQHKGLVQETHFPKRFSFKKILHFLLGKQKSNSQTIKKNCFPNQEKIRLWINKAHVELAMLSVKARGSTNRSSEASSTFPKSSFPYICQSCCSPPLASFHRHLHPILAPLSKDLAPRNRKLYLDLKNNGCEFSNDPSLL